MFTSAENVVQEIHSELKSAEDVEVKTYDLSDERESDIKN